MARRPGWGRLRTVLVLAVVLSLAGPPTLFLAYRVLPPPVTPLMLIRLAEGHALRQDWVAYERISPALADAVIAAEDNLFCEQTLGFDAAALRGQAEAWWAGERPRGASTITMQTAKNLLLWPGRDPVRKALEAWLTPQVALLWPKRRVLEVYLNVVEFGPGLYGAGVAARAFFGKPASDLTAREAALLAAVLPRLLGRSVERPGPYVRRHRQVVRLWSRRCSREELGVLTAMPCRQRR